ncbi:MAG: GntR family transcriptional regulator [Thermodesulfobacteriota bacterium]
MIRKTNQTRIAYDFIRNAIFRGELKPGTTISEEWLGNHLNISRTPVREALIRLQADGLITVVNNRASVTPITPVDIQEIYELRLLLEPYAARVCIGLIDKGEVRRVRDFTRRLLDETVGGPNGRGRHVTAAEAEGPDIPHRGRTPGKRDEERDRHVHDIHELIIGSTRNQRLLTITRTLQGQINLLLNAAERIPGRIVQSMEEHLCLIDAILADDPVKAEEHMRTHIRTNMNDMLNPANFRFIFKE